MLSTSQNFTQLYEPLPEISTAQWATNNIQVPKEQQLSPKPQDQLRSARTKPPQEQNISSRVQVLRPCLNKSSKNCLSLLRTAPCANLHQEREGEVSFVWNLEWGCGGNQRERGRERKSFEGTCGHLPNTTLRNPQVYTDFFVGVNQL